MKASAQPLNTVIGYSVVPTVAGISPTSGAAAGRDKVTITGTGFIAATGVSFGSARATAYTVDSDTQLAATSPPGSGIVDITVITPSGTSATSNADRFTYLQPEAGPAAQPGQATAQDSASPTMPLPVQRPRPPSDAT